MAENEKKREVKFLSSFAMAIVDVDEQVKHVQLTLVQYLDNKEIGCFMDVVDPSKVKLAE